MTADGCPVAPCHRASQGLQRRLATEVLERPFHQRPQGAPGVRVRQARVSQQALRHGFHDHAIVGREHGPRVVDRFRLRSDAKGVHAEALRQLLRRLHGSRHTFHGRPCPFEPVARALGVRDRLQRVKRPERGAGSDQGSERLLAERS